MVKLFLTSGVALAALAGGALVMTKDETSHRLIRDEEDEIHGLDADKDGKLSAAQSSTMLEAKAALSGNNAYWIPNFPLFDQKRLHDQSCWAVTRAMNSMFSTKFKRNGHFSNTGIEDTTTCDAARTLAGQWFAEINGAGYLCQRKKDEDCAKAMMRFFDNSPIEPPLQNMNPKYATGLKLSTAWIRDNIVPYIKGGSATFPVAAVYNGDCKLDKNGDPTHWMTIIGVQEDGTKLFMAEPYTQTGTGECEVTPKCDQKATSLEQFIGDKKLIRVLEPTDMRNSKSIVVVDPDDRSKPWCIVGIYKVEK